MNPSPGLRGDSSEFSRPPWRRHQHHHNRHVILGTFLLPFALEAAMVVIGLDGMAIVVFPPVIAGFVFLVRAFGPRAAVIGLPYVPLMWGALYGFAGLVGQVLSRGNWPW